MPLGKISKKQEEILEYIKSELLSKGYPPAVREICEAVHLKSTSSVHSHLETLEKNGYIRRESMINAGILDGDYVLIKQQSNAENGDMVVALVEDGATVKRFFKEEGVYRLQPENDFMDPIIVESVEILGKVIGVFRFMK